MLEDVYSPQGLRYQHTLQKFRAAIREVCGDPTERGAQLELFRYTATLNRGQGVTHAAISALQQYMPED